ncbi:MAG: RNA polymerase sigma factor [Clostridia bacterium]|nr:RNA polymerase sigma factor [Clostridia bacterium]
MIVFALTTEEIQDKNDRIEELLSLISDGDTASMGLLYDLIKTDVFAYALSKTGNKLDADDVMQDTFVKIYKYAKQYKPKGKPMAWIITIELNLIRRRFQLKSRTVGFDESFANTPSRENVEEKIINNAFLRELLKTLNEEEREVISLHIVSGMKHREIAKLLQKPLSTVLSKYNRAIKKLQLVVKEKNV